MTTETPALYLVLSVDKYLFENVTNKQIAGAFLGVIQENMTQEDAQEFCASLNVKQHNTNLLYMVVAQEFKEHFLNPKKIVDAYVGWVYIPASNSFKYFNGNVVKSEFPLNYMMLHYPHIVDKLIKLLVGRTNKTNIIELGEAQYVSAKHAR